MTESSNASSQDRRWRIVLLMMFYAALGHFNRVGIRRAGNDIFIEQMGMTPDQMGDVISAFLWVYTCCMLPGGWIIDRIGAARSLTLFGLGMGTCVALTGMWGWFSTPLPTFYLGLLVIRGCAGVFNVPLHPGAAQIVSHLFPPRHRTMANGMITAGAVLGIVVSYPLYGILIHELTWTWAFVVAGGAMVGYALWWNSASSSVNFRAGSDANPEQKPGVPSTTRRGGILANGQLWLVTLSYACYSYYQYLLFYWMEYYLKTDLKFSAVQIDRTSVLVNLAMAVGMVLGGLMNARLCHWLGDAIGRRAIVISGMCVSGSTGLIGLLFSDPISVTCCFALSTALLGMTEGVFWTAATESGGAYRGFAAALMNTGGNAGGSISPQISPRIADHLGWNGAFAAACVICALGGIIWLRIKPPPTADSPEVLSALP